jgi:hypothetical protein
MLRHKGLELRKKLQADLKEHSENWKALKRPASLHSASLILAEMLVGIPHADRDQFHEIGDGHVYMPLAIMEKYLYPTLHLMRYLHEHTVKCQNPDSTLTARTWPKENTIPNPSH